MCLGTNDYRGFRDCFPSPELYHDSPQGFLVSFFLSFFFNKMNIHKKPAKKKVS